MSDELVPLHPESDPEEDQLDKDDSLTIDASILPPEDQLELCPTKHEFRKMYSDLIETCQELNSGDGLGDTIQRKMGENVAKSQRLFDKICGNTAGPSDMYIACLHTKMLSQIIRYKSDTIGSASSGFKLDCFLEALKGNHRERVGAEFGGYDTKVLSRTVSAELTHSAITVPTLCNLMGSFDKDILAKPAAAKVKKPRAAPKKKNFEQTNPTKHIEVNVREEQRKKKDQSAVKLSMDLLHILQIYHTQNFKALGLYNFAMDKNSLAKTIKYIFYLGFLVREGRISLRRDEKAHLVVRPEKPPQKGEKIERQQYIFSITPRQWKALSAASQGEDIITAYKIAHLKSATPQKHGEMAAGPSIASMPLMSLPETISTPEEQTPEQTPVPSPMPSPMPSPVQSPVPERRSTRKRKAV